MPGGEVGGEEEGRGGNQQSEAPTRPVDRLPGDHRNGEQERQGQRQAPEAGGDRAHP